MEITAINPVWAREARCRWRNERFFGLMLAYALIICGLVTWLYNSRIIEFDQVDVGDADTTARWMAASGRELFVALTQVQTGLWLLLAPALTATSLAGEREAGLLESLQLSRLRPAQIVSGKLGSALSLLILLIIISLPALAVCFLLGGVSSTEFLLAALLHITTVLLGASLGLFISSRARRSTEALTRTFGVLGFWAIFTFNVDSIAGLFGVFGRGELRTLATLLQPLRMVSLLFEGTPANSILISGSELLWYYLPLQVLFSGLLCMLAVRHVAKPLPPAQWIDRDRWTDRLRERWQAEKERRAQMEAQREEQRQSSLESAKMALLWEFPIERFTRFANPILQREVRSRFRWRRSNRRGAVGRMALGLLAAIAWVILAFTVSTSELRIHAWWSAMKNGYIALSLIMAVLAAGSFSREREAGTWENLQLSPLSTWEVLRAKLAAPFITCFYYGMPFWPLLPFALLPVAADSYYGFQNVGAATAITSLLIVLTNLFALCSWSLLLSWLTRKTVTATSLALGSWLLIQGSSLAGMPLAQLMVRPDPNVRRYTSTLYDFSGYLTSVFHPSYTLNSLQVERRDLTFGYYRNMDTSFSAMSAAWWNISLNLLLGLVLMWLLWLFIERNRRERDLQRTSYTSDVLNPLHRFSSQ